MTEEQVRLANIQGDGSGWYGPERMVAGRGDVVPPMERMRYEFARDNCVGTTVLDLGCSSGYALRFLAGKKYTGIDKDAPVIEYAKKQFGDIPNTNFYVSDVDEWFKKNPNQYWDTIIAFEFLEHLSYGKELAQKLKKHCKCLIISCPYDEQKNPGVVSHHHKLFGLKKEDFPGFEYKYLSERLGLQDKPLPNGCGGGRELSLIIMKSCVEGQKESKKGLSVSVITSVYACSKFLETCIQSVKNQTHGDIEHILVSTGSPEAAQEEEIVRRLSHKRLFYCPYPQHGNLTQAWNKAIYFAQGDLIMNLNSDDWMEPEAASAMSACFEEDPDLGLAYSDLFCHKEDGSVWTYWKYDWDNNKSPEYCGPMPMWRKSLHKKLGMLDESFCYVADYDWWCRVGHHSKLKRVPKILLHYLERSSSLEHRGVVENQQQKEHAVVVQRIQTGYYDQPFH